MRRTSSIRIRVVYQVRFRRGGILLGPPFLHWGIDHLVQSSFRIPLFLVCHIPVLHSLGQPRVSNDLLNKRHIDAIFRHLRDSTSLARVRSDFGDLGSKLRTVPGSTSKLSCHREGKDYFNYSRYQYHSFSAVSTPIWQPNIHLPASRSLDYKICTPG